MFSSAGVTRTDNTLVRSRTCYQLSHPDSPGGSHNPGSSTGGDLLPTGRSESLSLVWFVLIGLNALAVCVKVCQLLAIYIGPFPLGGPASSTSESDISSGVKPQ